MTPVGLGPASVHSLHHHRLFTCPRCSRCPHIPTGATSTRAHLTYVRARSSCTQIGLVRLE